MCKKIDDRENAILSLALNLADLTAAKVADLEHCSQQWDSKANGRFWRGEAEKVDKIFLATMERVGGPHQEWVEKMYADFKTNARKVKGVLTENA